MKKHFQKLIKMSLEKKQLRKKVLEILANLSLDDQRQLSEKICSNIDSLLKSENLNPKHLGVFFPIPGEVNCLNLKAKAILSFPSFGEESTQMCFRNTPINELEIVQAFGKEFRVPRDSDSIIFPEVILVPGVAFDNEGHRLGRGKGYYDIYLNRLINIDKKKVIKIGVCFNQQLSDEVVFEEHDQAMDFIVTDREVIKVNK
ncbi:MULTISPECIES: 5-formyltetrahydrofolate cyclo-ligase [Pseudomonadati]|uniref:5-formyltetrahydrofolate cyclo-ligase n=1 Tax=unclassified Halobacteriovorax TaxID=2639665 RepID=UPI0011AFA1A4|nr:5-formyltetrahydrofolate cyclo-ligase [Halobacteriovorax sp. DA5]